MEVLLFLIGGRLYTWIEIIWRGWTHWTMFYLGGGCFVIMGLLNEHFLPWDMPLLQQAVISACIITALEFIVGYIVNYGLAGRFGTTPTCLLICWARYACTTFYYGYRFRPPG